MSDIFVAIGATPGGDDLLQRTRVSPTDTSATFYGLDLANGATYYTTVTAVDQAGWETSATTNGIIVDWTPPLFITATRGPPAAVAQYAVTDASSLDAEWVFEDLESGNGLTYEWRVCAQMVGVPDETECPVPWTSVGTATNVTADALSLLQGVAYHVLVRATNPTGLTATGATAVWVVDTTPPVTAGAEARFVAPSSVADGVDLQRVPLPSIESQFAWDTIVVQWQGIVDRYVPR